jgi:YVTN family beta-propeller protein
LLSGEKQLVMFSKFKLATICVASSLLFACENSENPTITPKGKYAEGVFILNEGQFGRANGSVSFYNRKNIDSVAFEGDIFRKANNRTMGDVVQDLLVVNQKAFIVVNNSNKIEIVDAGNFKSLAPEIVLKSPRRAVSIGNKLYVTEWVGASFPATAVVNGQVSVIDINTYQVLKTITVGKLPDKMLIANGKLYVANSEENTVTVINTNNDIVETTLTVADRPNGLQQDANGNIWVLCGGVPSWAGATTSAVLLRFSPNNPIIQTKFTFSSSGASNLAINHEKNTLFFSRGGAVFTMNITATNLPTIPLIRRSFYGLGIDKDGTIYGADALNYAVNGRMIRYNKNGVALDSATVGLVPNGFVFR